MGSDTTAHSAVSRAVTPAPSERNRRELRADGDRLSFRTRQDERGDPELPCPSPDAAERIGMLNALLPRRARFPSLAGVGRRMVCNLQTVAMTGTGPEL